MKIQRIKHFLGHHCTQWGCVGLWEPGTVIQGYISYGINTTTGSFKVLSAMKRPGDKCPSATTLPWEAPHHKPGVMLLFPEIPLDFSRKITALRAFLFPAALWELLLGGCSKQNSLLWSFRAEQLLLNPESSRAKANGFKLFPLPVRTRGRRFLCPTPFGADSVGKVCPIWELL